MKLVKKIYSFLFGPSCVVYVACKMTGRSRTEQIERALFMCRVLREHGIVPISPVLEEGVRPGSEALKPASAGDLRSNWARDKHILRYKAHVCLMDGADEGSVGMGREYGITRYCLWKPTLVLWSHARGLTVADFEDDAIVFSPQAAAAEIEQKWLSRWQRWTWRAKLLFRCLPQFLKDQAYAWR